MAFHGARVFRSTNQSISSGSTTPISFDTTVFDTDSFFSSGSPTKLTVPAGLGGYYFVSLTLKYASGANTRFVAVRANGTTNICATQNNGVSGSDAWLGTTSGIIHLNAGDYIELATFQTSGSPLNALSDSTNIAPVLMLAYLGA